MVTLSLQQGLQVFFAALPVAIAALASAIWQGKVCTAGVEMVAKRPTEAAKAMIYGILVEFYAVLGLIVTILAVVQMQL
jgi:V/A-type H+-transporting ATPase subunit K